MVSDVDQRAMVLEAMMNDLGNDRLEDLAKDHRDGNRILKCSIQSPKAPPPRVLTNENARGWNRKCLSHSTVSSRLTKPSRLQIWQISR